MISASGACRRGGPAVYFIKSCAIENIPVRTTMKLHVDSGGRRLDIDAPPGRHLSESLAEAGIRLDLRCGGNNRCGRCRVRLLSGRFAHCPGRRMTRTAKARARRTPPAHPGRSRGTDRNSGFLAVPGRPCGSKPASAALLPAPPPVRGESALAFDIGTTTVAAALVKDGAVLRTAGAPNAQSRFGDNVIDRIVAAGRSAGKRQPSFAVFSSKRP